MIRALLALIMIADVARGVEPRRLSPDWAYTAQKTNPVTYDVDYTVTVTPPSHSKVLKVWLPLPQSDAGQEVTEGAITTFPMKVTPKIGRESLYGNTFAYFEFDHPEGAQIIRHTFRIKVWELRWEVDPREIKVPAKWPDEFEPYLRAENQAVVVDDKVRKVAGQIAKNGPEPDLASIMDWVRANMKYDHAKASLQANAAQALTTGVGHCSDYHGLCASLGRALGHPTRVTYGINTFPKNSPSHCKLEAFLAPYGWVSFDVSETQRLAAEIQKDGTLDAAKKEALTKAATNRLRRGFRDNTWFLQTRGTDYDLAPPASKKVAVVRTIYAEADGVALPDPDPANPAKREFAWMTAIKFTPDRDVTYPFKGWKSLSGN